MKRKMITIGMCIGLLTLGISIGFVTQPWVSVPQQNIPDNRYVPHFPSLVSIESPGSQISLHTDIPEGPSSVKIYNISNPYSKVWAERIVSSSYSTWDFKNCNITEICNNNSTLFQNGLESITITNTGVFLYNNKSAQNQNDKALKQYRYSIETSNFSLGQYYSISSNDAYNVSINYILNHGGFPANYYLLSKSASNEMYRGYNYTTKYFFSFIRKIDGMPIIGEEGIKIWISGLGNVTDYIFQWREIANVDHIQKISSAKTALNALENIIYTKTNSPQINITVNGTNSTIDIYGIEVGYYSYPMFEMQFKMYPVWIFYTNAAKSKFVYTDAIKPS